MLDIITFNTGPKTMRRRIMRTSTQKLSSWNLKLFRHFATSLKHGEILTAATQDKGQKHEGIVIHVSTSAPVAENNAWDLVSRGKEAVKEGASGGVTHQVIPYTLNIWRRGWRGTPGTHTVVCMHLISRKLGKWDTLAIFPVMVTYTCKINECRSRENFCVKKYLCVKCSC